MKKNTEIEDVQHHRNGVGGEPFDVVLFRWTDDSGKRRNMVAVSFPDDEGGSNPRVAVLDRDLLANGNARFCENSWRGDHFAHEVRAAIKARERLIRERLRKEGWNR